MPTLTLGGGGQVLALLAIAVFVLAFGAGTPGVGATPSPEAQALMDELEVICLSEGGNWLDDSVGTCVMPPPPPPPPGWLTCYDLEGRYNYGGFIDECFGDDVEEKPTIPEPEPETQPVPEGPLFKPLTEKSSNVYPRRFPGEPDTTSGSGEEGYLPWRPGQWKRYQCADGSISYAGSGDC